MIQITINAGILKVERDYQELFKVPLTKDEAEVFQMAGSSVGAADVEVASVAWPSTMTVSVALPNSRANADGSREWALSNVVPDTIACFDVGEYTRSADRWAAYFWLKAGKGPNPMGTLRLVDKLTDEEYAKSAFASSPRLEFIVGDRVPLERALVLEIELAHYDNSQYPDLILQTGTRWRA